MMADTTFFAKEGFDITVEDEAVVQVLSWIQMAPGGQERVAGSLKSDDARQR